MYAIYKPSSTSTKTAGVVRDITRLIVENSTANLEFHDTNVTQIIDSSVPSGWSLAGSQTFSTDTDPGINDTRYVLEADSRIGTNKKYCAIKMSGNRASSTVYSKTAGSQYGIKLSGIFDYGGANEHDSVGRSDTSSTYMGRDTISFRAHGYNTTLYIFAKQDSITIVGSDYDGYMQMECITEFADNEMTQMYRDNYPSSVPVTRMQRKSRWTDSTNNTHSLIRYYGDNQTTAYGQTYNQFIQCLYSPKDNEYYRNFIVGFKMAVDPVYDQTGRWFSGRTEDGTTTGGTSTSYNYLTGENSLESILGWSDMHSSFNHYFREGRTGTAYRRYKVDANGNNVLPLYPKVMTLDFMNPGTILNLSEYSGVYNTRIGLGANTGDTITIGSDVYVYFTDADYNWNNLEFIVKAN